MLFDLIFVNILGLASHPRRLQDLLLHLANKKKQLSDIILLAFFTIPKEPSPSFRLHKVMKADI